MKRTLLFVTLLYAFALLLLRPENTLSFICERHGNPPAYAEWCYFVFALLLYTSIVVFGALTLKAAFLRVQQQSAVRVQPKRPGFIKTPWQTEKKTPVEPEEKAKNSVAFLITVLLVTQALALGMGFRKHQFPDFVRQGYYQLADLCLLLGADPDAENSLYKYCCGKPEDEENKREALRRITYLLKSGANPNKTYGNGRTPVDE